MKYGFLPRAMWAIFRCSFQRQLPLITKSAPVPLMRRVKNTYREILQPIPDFDKDDRFLVNILSAAMLAAAYLNLPEKPRLEAVTSYYHRAMTENTIMKAFLKKSDHYNSKMQAKFAHQAEASQSRSNPYTWRFRYEAGPSRNSYSAYFDTCGILYLFQKLGISEITPAMCTYDYDMAEMGGSIFTRQHTLAQGCHCCDCHYQKR
jgi:hypothetical protein